MTSIWSFFKTSEGASLVTAISTLVLMLTTIVYARLTAVLTRENKLLRKAATEPQVVAYLSPDQRNILQFILANVGQGPALDVSYRITDGGEDSKLIRLSFLSRKCR